MKCQKCEAENPDGSQLCHRCGNGIADDSTDPTSRQPKTSSLAIASFVLGIASVILLLFAALPAIILGIVSLLRIERSGGRLTGRGFAVLGIVIPVVAVPTIVAFVLLPALNRVKAQAMDVMCRSNLHGWALAYSMYCNYNDDCFFSDVNWPESLRPHYRDDKQLFCPRAVRLTSEGAKSPFAAWESANFKGSYGMNFWTLNPSKDSDKVHADPSFFWRYPRVRRRSNEIPVLVDCSSSGAYPSELDQPPEYDGAVGTSGMAHFCINRHEGYVNALFMDWSVRKVGLKELWTLQWYNGFSKADPWTLAGGVRAQDWPEWMGKFKDY